MKNYFLSACLLMLIDMSASAQSFDLLQLLKDKKLETFGKTVTPITENGKQGVTTDGIAWLPATNFSKGTIEIDLRGRDVLQKSFLGIAFHGVDTSTYDCIYFRPFNFQSSDPVRKIHAVQYVSHPDYPWYRLREERNGIYEKAVTPAPNATEWFHARIVVDDSTIVVYVNDSATPSLTVTKLNDRKDGRVGIFSFGLTGDFANLVISK